MSPEQATGERVDARSDLYSTGCLLYELLTGRLPFSGESPVAIAYQHVKEDPVPPSRVDRQVPAWADAIVLKAMQKDPAQRYQSAAEMRADIQRALAGDTVTVPRRKAWPWVTLAVAIIVVAAAILGVKALAGSNKVGVPSVTGLSLVRAENVLTGAGLRPGQVSYAPSASVAKNHVISANPSPGTQVSKGSPVNLVASKGPMPAVRHPHSGHGHSARPAPNAPSAPGPTSPAPDPTGPSPSPSTSCVVNVVGVCV